MIDHRSYTHNWKKNSGLNGIRTHDLCDTGAVLWSRSELDEEGEECKRKIIYLNCKESHEDMVDHHSYTHNVSSFEIRARKKFRPERDSNLHD